MPANKLMDLYREKNSKKANRKISASVVVIKDIKKKP